MIGMDCFGATASISRIYKEIDLVHFPVQWICMILILEDKDAFKREVLIRAQVV